MERAFSPRLVFVGGPGALPQAGIIWRRWRFRHRRSQPTLCNLWPKAQCIPSGFTMPPCSQRALGASGIAVRGNVPAAIEGQRPDTIPAWGNAPRMGNEKFASANGAIHSTRHSSYAPLPFSFPQTRSSSRWIYASKRGPTHPRRTTLRCRPAPSYCRVEGKCLRAGSGTVHPRECLRRGIRTL